MTQYTSVTDADRAAAGTEIEIDVRGRTRNAIVREKPLYRPT